MDTETALAYEHCQRITKSEAKNFYYGFRTLPVNRRLAIYAAYAFCRICDDIADGPSPVNEKKQLLSQTRQALLRAKNTPTSDPIFTALTHTIKTFNISTDHFASVIDGVEMDLVQTRYQNFADLREYCYKVASSVGLICIEIFGYKSADAKLHAIDIGIAMQLTNILRDLKEDAQRGRIYIPLNEIVSFGYSEEELMRGIINDAFRSLMRHQTARAKNYFKNGQKLLPLVPVESRACPTMLIEVYSRILGRIEESDFDVFTRRVKLGSIEKLIMVAKLWTMSLTSSHIQKR